MDISPHPLTLTVEQAAKILGISRSTAYELVHTGDIPSLRLGRRLVIPIGQLAEQLGIPVEQVRESGLDTVTTDAALPPSTLTLDRPSGRPPQRPNSPSTLF